MARPQKSQQVGVTRHRGILGGKPIIRGTRISVEFILDLLAAGMTPAAVAREYRIPSRAISAALANAALDFRRADVIGVRRARHPRPSTRRYAAAR